MGDIIKIDNLYKYFGEVHAVEDLSFRVKKGELFAFLGVNGAGKSTTISIICGLLKKDKGNIEICSNNIENSFTDVANRLGVVFQNSALDGQLTVKDCLRNRASLYGITGKAFKERLDELARLLDFEDLTGRTIGKLSGGQRRRIDIARALLHKPEILILDEPTTGLDPQTRSLLWEVLTNLRKEANLTVFLTTHYMEEAADADYVIILNKGKIAAEGTPLQLKNEYAGDYITLYNADPQLVDFWGYKYENIKNAVRVSVPNTEVAKQLIKEYPDAFRDFEITKGKMDDVFLAVTGAKLVEGGEAK